MKNTKDSLERLLEKARLAEVEKGLVSVVFPIYGSFDVKRLLSSIASVRMQRDVECEIVVSEQGESPRVKSLLDDSIRYTFKHFLGDNLKFNSGEIRNDAIALSHGEYVYTNDSDVVFQNPYFLSKSVKLLASDEGLVMYRPPMRRLPIDNFEEFYKRVSQQGIQRALDSLNRSREFLATTDDIKRDLKVVARSTEEYLKVFTASMEDFNRYILDPSLKGKEPTIWSENLHCGGNFFRRKHLDMVGGYAEKFFVWGCEDSDLQWKFGKCFNLQFYPKIEEFTVLHLDHPKGYFSPENWARNEEISRLRKKRGIYSCILEDRNAKE